MFDDVRDTRLGFHEKTSLEVLGGVVVVVGPTGGSSRMVNVRP